MIALMWLNYPSVNRQFQIIISNIAEDLLTGMAKALMNSINDKKIKQLAKFNQKARV
jgi:hypothetical protein